MLRFSREGAEVGIWLALKRQNRYGTLEWRAETPAGRSTGRDRIPYPVPTSPPSGPATASLRRKLAAAGLSKLLF